MSDNSEKSDRSSFASSETRLPSYDDVGTEVDYYDLLGQFDRFHYDQAWIAYGLLHAGEPEEARRADQARGVTTHPERFNLAHPDTFALESDSGAEGELCRCLRLSPERTASK